MAAVWYRFRAELRTRWQSMIVLALLVGVAGGVALAALAGARRTDSAFSRLYANTKMWDILVNPDMGTDSVLRPSAVERLPMVASAAKANGIGLFPSNARTVSDLDRFGTVIASDGRSYYRLGRPKVEQGRLPDPRRSDEVLINPVLAAREHLGVGDRIHAVALTRAGFERLSSGAVSIEEGLAAPRRAEIGPFVTLRVAGIGVNPEEIVVDEGFADPAIALSPAFLARHREVGVPFWGEVVRLRRGAADIPAFRKAVEALAPDEAIAFQTLPVTAVKADRAVRPSVGALTIFAIVVVLTGLLVVGQAFTRQIFLESVDAPSLRALGVTRAQLFATAMVRVACVACIGALLAVFLAIAFSPLTPIGVARTAEPNPGVRVDGVLLALGALTVIVAVLALAALPAWHYARTRAGLERDTLTTRPSRISRGLLGAGASVSLGAGIRMALEPGRGRTAVPVRTTIISALLAIATVTGALVFAASLDHLVSTPRLYGWNWGVRMSIDSSTHGGNTAKQDVARLLNSSRSVQAWSTVTLSDVVLGGRSIPALGIDPSRGRVAPSLVSGRVPKRANEIALGARTLRALGVNVGDTVAARLQSGGAESLRVVGRVVLPGFGTYPGSDKTALGEGAVVTNRALQRLGPDFNRHPFLVEFRAGADRQPVIERARRITATTTGDPEAFSVHGVQRPSDIVAYDRVRTTPIVLAGVLALLAAATVAHALVTAVRRRRRDLALFKTLGFTRAQVLATVAWQATTVGVLALIVGIPLGIVLGRWGWNALADNLGTVAEPVVPALAVSLVIPAVLVLVNLIAFVPGRIAARIRPAVVLRSE
jgi:ABC-type lipoprotein release transport system permease subunit